MIQNESDNEKVRSRKPMVQIVQYTKGTLLAQTIQKNKLTFYKIAEWSIIYFLSYMGFGYGWILFFGSVYHMKTDRAKNSETKQITSNDGLIFQNSINGLTCLPSWIKFPDFDRVDWINLIINQIWPNLDSFANSYLKSKIEPKIQIALERKQIKNLADFEFVESQLGKSPIRVEGIKVYETKINEDMADKVIIADCDILYKGDSKIKFSIQGFLAEISSITFRGMVRIQLQPLHNQVPFIGGIEVFFLERPFLEYDMGGIGNLADFPGISPLVRSLVDDEISSKMVWPNRLRVTLSKNIVPMPLIPAGALRIIIVEGRDLVARDRHFGGSGKSDPYAIVSCGERKVSFKHRYVSESLNPKWNYEVTFAIENPEGHKISIDIYDFNKMTNDDFLGRVEFSVEDTIKSKNFNKWLKLGKVESGEVHAMCEWKIAKPASELTKGASKDCYLVSLFVHECKNLAGENSDVAMLYPTCLIEFKSASSTTEFNTNSKNKTKNPVFRQGQIFISNDPKSDQLRFSVFNAMKKTKINFGELQISIQKVLSCPNQELINEVLSLEGGHENAKIVVSIKLYAID